MIITTIVALGLILLTIFVGLKYNWKASLAVLVPLLYLGYWTISVQVPKFFGYAIALNFAELNNQARYISGFEGKDAIFFLLLEKGDTEPRLFKVPNTPQNKQALSEFQKQEKAGKAVVVRKGKKSSEKEKNGNASPTSESDIMGVELKDQNVVQKGE